METPKKTAICRAILVVKNEDDIIESQIQHLGRFCQQIFILDNGSTDRTVEFISKLASENVTFLGSITLPFFDNMRNWVWQMLKGNAADGDWWLLADADEFFEDEVIPFLSSVPLEYGVVMKRQIYPIPVEGQEQGFQGLQWPDFDFFTNYYASTWAEPRFFWQTKHLKLSVDSLTFSRARAIYPVAIKLRHYNWRSAKQVEKRIETRRQLLGKSPTDFRHMDENNWQDVLKGKYARQSLPFSEGIKWPEDFQNWRPRAINVASKTFLRLMAARVGII